MADLDSKLAGGGGDPADLDSRAAEADEVGWLGLLLLVIIDRGRAAGCMTREDCR